MTFSKAIDRFRQQAETELETILNALKNEALLAAEDAGGTEAEGGRSAAETIRTILAQVSKIPRSTP